MSLQKRQKTLQTNELKPSPRKCKTTNKINNKNNSPTSPKREMSERKTQETPGIEEGPTASEEMSRQKFK